MANLTKQFRSPHSPSPIYGIRPGFTVGDLDRMYATETVAIASTSSATVAPTAISTKARVVKLTINVTAGTGSVTVSVKSASDTYTATIATTDALTLGTHDFYIGGWSSPASGDTGYAATQYGPVLAGNSPNTGNSTGDEETTNPDPSANNNYVGGVYNPTNFLSLDGYDIKVYAAISGSVTYDVSVTPVS